MMGKKKKDTVELRFYEVPQNEYVLALLGDSWIRDYGYDDINLHFHNLMEIGFCRNGLGEMILDAKRLPYQPAMVNLVPHNYPHVTISSRKDGPSFWEYLFFDPAVVIAEMFPDDLLCQRKMLEKVNKRAILIHEWENRNLAVLVKMIMEEMRSKRPHYTECVKGLAITLVSEIIRFNESDGEWCEQRDSGRKNTGISQICAALDYVKTEYTHLIKVEELAKVCHMSETHFRRVFEACINMSPVDYMNLVRIQKACDLMKKSNDSMDIIAVKVGFTTTSTFNRNFKKFLNTSPYQWKINPGNYERKLLNYHISALKGW